MKKKTIIIILFVVVFSLCGCGKKEENKETTNIEEKVEIKDNYSVSGYLLDKEGNPVKNANLVIYSDTPHYIKTDDKGYFYSNGLEKGSHEIYYVKNDNPENLTKEEIKNNSILKIDLSTENKDIKYSNEDYSLDKFNIENNTVNNTYTITLNPNGGNVDKTTIEVTRNTKYYEELPIPTKDGYTFVGWYYNDELVTKDTIVKLNEEHTLLAKYNLDAEILTYNDVYDGKEHTFEVKPKSESVKITYSLDNEKYSEDKYTFKNVGEYTIYYKVTANNEEKIYKDKLIITKSNNTIKLSSNEGTTIYPNTISVNVEENDSKGKIIVESSNTSVATVSITNNIITIKPISIGEVNITVKTEETVNYKETKTTYKLTINKGTFSVSSSGYESTYDGNNHSITVNPSIEGTTITYSTDNKTFIKDKPSYKNAGEYKVYYKVEKDNYETVSGSEIIKITPSTNTLSIDKTSGNITYPGSDVITVTTDASITATSSNESIATTSVNGNQVTVTAGTTSGTATITITTVEDANHNSASATYIANVMSTTVTTIEVNYNGSYDGQEHTGSITSLIDGITYKYGLTQGTYDLNDIPKYTNSGVYTIYYEASKEGYTSKTGSITVTITKINNTLTLNETSGSITYPNTKTFNITKNTSNGTLSVVSSDESIATVSLTGNEVTVTPIKDGNVTLTVTSSETTNYNSKSISYTLTINKGTFTVSHNGFEGSYDGENHNITVTPSINETTITYSTDNVTFTSVNPTYVNSGTYTVYYKVEKTGYETVTNSETIKINKLNNTVSINKTSGNITYPNTDTVTITTNANLNIESSNENIATTSLDGNTLTITSGITEGVATITISTINDINHNGQSVTYTANVSHGTINISASNYNGTYDGNTHTGSVTSTLEGVSIKFGTTEGTYNLDSLPEYIDSGVYTIYYEAKKDGYNTVNNSITVTINKAENTLSLSETSGSTIYPNNKIFNVTENTSNGTLSVESSNTTIATVSISNNVVTVKPLKSGNVTLNVTSLETTNYNSKTTSYTLTINKGTFNVDANGYNFEYDGNAHSITVNPSIDGTTITYSTDNVTFTSTNPEYTNAGEYTVYYKVEKDNYETVTGNRIVKINPSTNTLSIDKTSGDITYPGSDVITVTTSSTITATSSNDSIATVSVNNNQVTVTAGTTQGIATITISTVGDSNHNSASATYTANVSNGSFELTKVNYNGTYDGSEHTGTLTSTTSDITFKYGETSDTYNLTELPKYTNAGVYTIYYEASKEGYLTQNGTLTVTINKADNTLTLSETSGSITYPNTKTITVTANTSGGTLSATSSDTTLADVSANGNNITITSKLKEGTSTITVTSAETTNYNSASVTYTATIVYPSYNVTFTTTNATVSTSTLSVKYAGTNTVTITPNSGYYLSSVSCTNGYTTNASVGDTYTSAQNVTISNNSNQNTSVCTISTTSSGPRTIYSIVASQAVSDTVDFSVRSGTSGTNGVYTTTSTEGNVPVYYYRGSVDNHVIFNNMCWRIVRTTETGGVKLIYNGTPTDGTCTATGSSTQIGTSAFNSTSGDNAYVGYMYGTAGSSTYAATHTNTNSSTIKTYIDNWYSTNFTSSSVTSKIEDTVYCNDRSTVAYDSTKINWSSASSYGTLGYGTNKTLYGAINRAAYETITPSPTLVCSQENDKFTVSGDNGNGALTYPVGLITLDEAVFAGFNTNKSNTSDYEDTNNYLYTGSDYWTLSPVTFTSPGRAYVGYVYSFGDLSSYIVFGAYGVRPAVSLKDGTLVSSGNGSSSSPYIISIDKVTVTYNPGDGTVDTTSGIQTYGSNYEDLPTPTRSGYNFDGWYTESSGGTQVTESTTVSDYSPHTLYAHWSSSVNTNSLYYKVSSQAVSDTVDFSVRSGTSGTNGVYTTTSTEGNVPVYYYRGNVDNHVIFNNMCWRIVRTTETGGVKLIYNGTPSSGQCTATGSATQLSSTTAFNSSYNDNAYVGYMYGTTGSSTYAATHTNTNSSTIKTYIDNWYSTNFTSTSVTSKIEDTVYCNDRSTVAYDSTKINWSSASSYGTLGYGTNKTLYGAINRAAYETITPSPTLVCSQENDKFTVSGDNGNGALTYPVGLITLDEAVFAGFNTYASNTSDYNDTNNYLCTGSYYWTLSPVYFYSNGYANVGNVYSYGYLRDDGVSYTYGVRPAVSLKDGTLVSSGNGSSSSPYIIE